MFIKKIEIFGFKSFKNKTILEFDDKEITGVVGPNGCGKSNVVEALLWVMGESSPANLRGESLSDVIFNGTQKEPAAQLATVHLTLNKGTAGFPEEYKDFSELMITRRAYRDGKNEYLINNQTCLLKDIREFFMNTGAGCKGFSIIEQGSIEKLIVAKPKDRRFFIEDLAGIAKFKNRKQESMRKLDLVNQNLKRVNDVLSMQDSQLQKLTKQARQAKQYRELKKDIEIKNKQIEEQNQQDIFKSYQELQTKKLELNKNKNQYEQAHITLKKDKLKISQNLQDVEQKLENLNKQTVRKSIEFKTFSKIESIKDKKKVLNKQESYIKKNLIATQVVIKNKFGYQELEQEIKKINQQIDTVKTNKKDIEFNNILSTKQIQFIEKEITYLVKENQDLKTKIQKTIQSKNDNLFILEKQKQLHLKFDKELAHIFQNEKTIENKQFSLKKITEQLAQDLQILDCKTQEMKKLIVRFEKLNKGAQDLLQWHPENFQSLFKNLQVDEDYAEALASVLGHHIQAIIPKENTFISQAIERLKSKSLGRTSFISSLPCESIAKDTKHIMQQDPAFICFLDEKVRWNIHTEAFQSFLSHTVVVSNLDSAFALKKRFPTCQFVTKEGDFITKESLIYAGSNDKETSLFQIRDHINSYSKEHQSKSIELKIKKLELESCTKKYNQIKKQKADVHKQNLDNSQNTSVIKQNVLSAEKDIINDLEFSKKNQNKLDKYNQEKQELLKNEDSYKQEVHSFEKIISIKNKCKEELLNQLKYEQELVENKKEQKNLDQEILLFFDLLNQTSSITQKIKEQLSHKENLSMEGEFELLDKQIQILKSQLTNLETELDQKTRLKASLKDQQELVEKDYFQSHSSIKNLELSIDKVEFEKNHLQQDFLKKYQVQVDNFVCTDSQNTYSLTSLNKQKDSLQKQLARIQEVNFLALNEYENLSKEHTFLSSQKEDLVKSKTEIIKVISHIDKLCNTRFNDMLQEINKRFSKVFSIIFQGQDSKAELTLCQEDTEEPGVNILIHPPGKQAQNVNLLSKGEKALTAICLIYSLFLIQPSPFCIIDEADAPLDDANIFRFISVFKEMAQKSQIIVITHNKYTMQACNKLYGVTMNSPGISQMVSVNMNLAKENKLSI